MSEPKAGNLWPRRLGAGLAGMVAVVVLSMGADAVLHATGVYPPLGQHMSDPLFALALGYRMVFDGFGSWLAARLAPDHPMRHAMALGWIGLLLTLAGSAAMAKAGPAWYAIALLASILPTAWLGGRLASAGRAGPA